MITEIRQKPARVGKNVGRLIPCLRSLFSVTRFTFFFLFELLLLVCTTCYYIGQTTLHSVVTTECIVQGTEYRRQWNARCRTYGICFSRLDYSFYILYRVRWLFSKTCFGRSISIIVEPSQSLSLN